MRPESFNARLHALLDRRERPEDDDLLRSLAEESPACREALAAQQRLFEGLEADEAPELPKQFAERVVAQALATPHDDVRLAHGNSLARRTAWIFELAAVAALVLLAVGGWSMLSPSHDQRPVIAVEPGEAETPSPADSFAIHPAPPSEVDAPAPAPPAGDPPAHDIAVNDAPVAPTAADAGRRYDELYQAILQRLPEHRSTDDLLALRPQWVDEVALGLRPVAASFGGAINTLRSTLPPSNKSDRPEKPQAGVFEIAPLSALA